jgi:cytochrome b|tara:strand:- start:477 stop:1019 length:543 start_codon:yes stop_codon:yes gene_type:complete
MLNLHQYFGVSLLGLISFRILWGFVGTYYSRFKSFNLSVTDALSQFSKTNSITSVRTPIGSYSTLIFIIALLSISASGLFSSDDVLYDAPLAFLTPNYTSYFTYIHNILHYLLYSLIGIHILAIMYYQIFKKIKIIERVIDGYSRIEKLNIVTINEKPLAGILLLLILTFLPIFLLLYFS